jgi:Raf kinase inhibitor-like YbhB/YbcL family protein
MNTTSRTLVLAFAVVFASLPLAASAAEFTLAANGMADDAMIPNEMGFNKTDAKGVSCGGVNRAPTLAWSNAPANTQSYAILEVDPGGASGAGVNHWVVYNIPASASGISSAEVAAGKYSPGRGAGDLVGYRGPCPPVGDAPHHYLFTLIALDLPPTLAAGLDHDGLLAAMKGHVLGTTTLVERYQRT